MPGSALLQVHVRVAGDGADRPRLDVEFELGAGITAVMGPSGAGKSTLLLAIAGLVRPDEGRIVLDGVVLFDGGRGAFVRAHLRHVALVFQSLALFPHLTARENVAYGLPSMTKAQRRERAMFWLGRARVGHLAERMPAQLSGGEAQRVALARALASEPRALLLDEPFSALDSELRRELGGELQMLAGELDIPVILVTHHHEDAMRLGSRMLTLEAGRIRAGALSSDGTSAL